MNASELSELIRTAAPYTASDARDDVNLQAKFAAVARFENLTKGEHAALEDFADLVLPKIREIARLSEAEAVRSFNLSNSKDRAENEKFEFLLEYAGMMKNLKNKMEALLEL